MVGFPEDILGCKIIIMGCINFTVSNLEDPEEDQISSVFHHTLFRLYISTCLTSSVAMPCEAPI